MKPPSLNLKYLFYRSTLICTWLAFFAAPAIVMAQTVPQWDRDFGGNIWEELNSVEQTADGGYILAGFSSSSQNGDFMGTSNGSGDYWLVKTDDEGIIEWEANYGGSGLERPWAVQQTTDGGYIVAGYSPSDVSGDKTSPSRGLDDYWIVKVDATGGIQWDMTYGGDNLDQLYSIIETSDGGYLMGGRSLSGISGEKSEANKGSWDYWLVKVDVNGVMQWDKTLGGADEDLLNMVQEAPDGNYYVGGGIRSDNDGLDVNTNLLGVKDFWFLKISSLDGTIIDENRYGGTDEDEMQGFVQTQDGGFLLAGGSRSNISPDKSQNNFGIVDMWVIKIDATYQREWDQTFGGDNIDNCYSISQNSVGNFLLGGFTGPSIGPSNLQSTLIGGWDYLLVYLAEDGTYLWDQAFGGDQNDVLESVFQTDDGGYVLAGHSSSGISGDKTEDTKGLNDFWMIKTDCSVFVDFADTIVCPNQPVELNAYTGSNCLDCTWVWNDIGIGDSIRIIESNAEGTYSVLLADGVGCTRTDQIVISYFNTSTVNIGDSLALCDGENATLDATNPTGISYEWSTGDITPSLLVDAADVYAVTVTDNNSCELEDSIMVTVGALPIIELGNDTTICAGETLTLDAGNPGAQYTWLPVGTGIGQTVSLTNPGVYFVSVDDNGCTSTDQIELTNFDIPSMSNLIGMCNDSNTTYIVSFEIIGGDASSYDVTGDAGNLLGNIFTSTPILLGEAYSFFVDDTNNCAPQEVAGSYDCECTSDAGVLDQTPLTICGNDMAVATHNAMPVLDNNDQLIYILHDGTATMIGAEITNATTPEFAFQGGMIYGTIYYITAVVGNSDGNGGIMLQDGCLSIGDGVAVSFFEPPSALITPLTSLTITCDESQLVLDGAFSSAPSGTLEYFWEATDGGNIISTNDEAGVELDEAGTYILTVTNQPGGCTDTAMITVVSSEDLPVVSIQDPIDITCINTIVEIDASASSSGMGFEALWSGGSLTGNTTLNPEVTQGGTYTLTVTNTANGCTDQESITVLADNQDPVLNLNPVASLNCLSSETNLVGAIIGAVGGYQVSWSTQDGNIVSGENTLDAIVNAQGTYDLLVVDEGNGCSATATTVVNENPDMPDDVLYTVTPPTCYGEDDAVIEIDSVIGGTPDYTYSFEGGPFTTTPFSIGLEEGLYAFTVMDDMACTYETEIPIVGPSPLIIELGDPSIVVELGDSLHLQALIDVTQNIDTFIWTSPNLLSCYDCLRPWITPLNETFVIIEVTSPEGCTASDRLEIFVQKDRNIYIPNAFSPNGDGRNDYFTIYGGKGVERINYLRVFDRWGETVFASDDLPLNFDTMGWDGTFKGKTMDSGVFIFVAEIEFTDGYVEKYSGDVSILK